MLRLAGLLWLLAGLTYLASEAIAAAAFPGYSYAHNYISDLGVPYEGMIHGRALRSSRAFVMNFGGFVLDGALFAAATGVALRAFRDRGEAVAICAVLGIVHALGTILVGIVHGGDREMAAGIHHIHVIGAAMAIIGGNAALIAAAFASRRCGAPAVYRRVSVALGVSGFVSLALLQSGTTSLPEGLLERGSVYPITIWEIVTGIAILAAVRNRRTGPR
jgi:hypothetical membrane protein